ncbi:bis(5'-nucleosyl)-tetraphosphatase PrpE [Bacillus daqingensis]|uniref:Bis(5'-nucleosyl)-tetraphosphatase PrpE n=1 Tax=Bacillus daqingensis TaxID=872396 RepID=A0ABV9NPP8_9BACI
MYDLIGDIHGCRLEMHQLIRRLGYSLYNGKAVHPDGRRLVFIGDLTDRGPDSTGVIEDVASFVSQGHVYVPGNHCDKLYRWFLGRNVKVLHGLETTTAEVAALSKAQQKAIRAAFMKLYEEAPLYEVLDQGGLVAAHAGIRYDDIGLNNKRIKSFVLYGDTTGKVDADGKPERRDWATIYPQGKAWIVYGHTPVEAPRFVGHTVNIDTGCVFGGRLTAFRYPEIETVSVASSMPRVDEKFRTFK